MVVHRGDASQGMELKIRVPDLSLGSSGSTETRGQVTADWGKG
jgi:hypothetical protein